MSYEEIYDAADFDLESEFSAAINAVYSHDVPRSNRCMSDEEVEQHANRQHAAAVAALKGVSPEIAKIVRSNPDYDNGESNGYTVTNVDATGSESYEVSPEQLDPIRCFANAERSFIERFADHANYYVGNLRSHVDGFNPTAFARHVKVTTKTRRYHGIDDICLDKAGRVRTPRKPRCGTATQ